MSPKKKRTKKSRMKARAKENPKTRLRRTWRKAQEMGFKSPEEHILYDELRINKIDVRHNVHLRGTEIDLYVPPRLIIEVGHRDEMLLKKWDDFVEAGFSFLYFSKSEINNSALLKRCVEKIIEKSTS